jgi:transcriptional regulator with XRE-family HTH domain
VDENRIGDFLRARRELVRPEDVGLPSGPRRRVKGLRREELALLAGVSVDYYIRLEQGRERRPSPQVCDALGRALGLDAVLTAHLHELARPAARRRRRTRRAPERVRPGILRLLEADAEGPAFVLGTRLDVLAANPLAAALHPAFAPGSNLARALFLDPAAPDFFADWEHSARATVASLRHNAGSDLDDPDLIELVGELSLASPAFRSLWARHDVIEKTGGRSHVHHPLVGELELGYESLTVNGTRHQVLMTFFAEPGSPSAHALKLLASLTAEAPASRRTQHSH